MKPRQSKASYSPLPKEYCQHIQSVLENYFMSKLSKVRWIIEGRIYEKEICILSGFTKEKELQQKNIILSIDFDPQKDRCQKKIEDCMNLLANILEHHLKLKSRWPHSPKWYKALSPFKKGEVYFQTSTVNTELEEAANRILDEVQDKAKTEASKLFIDTDMD